MSAQPRPKNWKLLVDPELRKGRPKLFRVNGDCPEKPDLNVRCPVDPRLNAARFRSRFEPLELPVPPFTIDANYVGEPPRREVSFFDLNDNVDQKFLANLCRKCGEVSEVQIFYNPNTKRHLGIGRVAFKTTKGAKDALERYDKKSVMGRVITAISDPHGREVKVKYRELIGGKARSPVHGHEASTSKAHTPPMPPPEPSPTGAGQGSPSVVPDDPMVAPSLPAPPPFLQSAFLPSLLVPPPPPEPPPEEPRRRRREEDEERRRRRSREPRDRGSREKSKSRGSLQDEKLEAISSSSEEGETKDRRRRRKSKSRRRSSSRESNDSRDADHRRRRSHRRRTPSLPPKASSPATELEMSLEHRIQSILRGAEEEVMKVVSEDKKSKPTSADADPDVICLEDVPASAKVPREPLPRSDEARKPRRRSRFDQPGPSAVLPRPPPPPPRMLSQPLWPPGNFSVPPPPHGFPGAFPTWPPPPTVVSVSLPPPPFLIPPPPVLPVLPPPPLVPRMPEPVPTERLVEKAVDRSLDILLKDLSKVLSRDVGRKFVDAAVVSTVDEWWDDAWQQLEERRPEEEEAAENLRQFSSDTAAAMHNIEAQASEQISSTVNKMFGEEANLSGLPGFGFKASLRGFRLPTIKKKVEPSARRRRRDDAHEPSVGAESRASSRASEKKEVDISSSEDEEEELDTSKAVSRASTVSPAPRPDVPVPSSDSSDSEEESRQSSNIFDSLRKQENSSTKDTIESDEDTSVSPSPEPQRAKSRSKTPLEGMMRPGSSSPFLPYLYDHCYTVETDKWPLAQDSFAIPPSPPDLSGPPAADARKRPVHEAPFKLPDEPAAVPKKKARAAARVFPKRPRLLEDALIDVVAKDEQGMDMEDMMYLRRCFESLRADPSSDLTDTSRWYPHPPALSPDAKAKPGEHLSGCARAEGFYKLSHTEKRSFMRRASVVCERTAAQSQHDIAAARQQAQMGREARSVQRRILTSLGNDVLDSELLKSNQLKFRKKLIRFGRSSIHGWGLFALEDIAPDEMIVEYVGQKIRLQVAERREFHYMRRGIGSSYLFRVDGETVIDATNRGNMARFINHSCQPSCYAKIITVEGSKRIVIYSKVPISTGQEITYDYKFPLEDDKIPCLCRANGCRGTLN